MADCDTMAAGLMGGVVERLGCPVHYWVGGEGTSPRVVMLHGATMDGRMFNAQVTALLGNGYRVLVLDQRGHGASQPVGDGFTLAMCAEDVWAVVDALGEREVVLLGQSMGGYVAQYAYLHQPERVKAMVIIGATCIAMPYALWEVIGLTISQMIFNVWPYDNFVKVAAEGTAKRPEVQAYAKTAIARVPRETFLQVWPALAQAVDRKGIPGHKINVPLLMTHGELDDRGTIRARAAGWVAYEPDVRYVVIPGAGHNANQDNAEFFNAALVAFLNERPG